MASILRCVCHELETLPWLAWIFRENQAHSLAVILLIARVADVVSTRLATPNLRLEGNPLLRRLGWPFAWGSVLLCFLPYMLDFGRVLAVPAIVLSLLVSSMNFSRGWSIRAIGEDAYRAHLLRVFGAATPTAIYGSIAAASLLMAGVGGLLLLFYPQPSEWAYYFAIGILLYACAMWLYSTLGAARMFREIARSRSDVA